MLSGKKLALVLLVVIAGLGSTDAALAQGGRSRYEPPRRPPVSPYLNLLRSNEDPAVNYYALVRPEIELRKSIERQAREIHDLQRFGGAAPGGARVLTTGHESYFLNLRSYFGSVSGAAGGRTIGVTSRSRGR
ncbi:MAG: hypothetical protein HYS13_12465 [Planctomycetia bacterium]|nr:hypothetical protein [Planctomycetia bacterium]